ncbi:porin family protein [Sphingobacterium sp. MYb382]|uniref:porin family protein n=1 Tax=Sphingobacterium sp. MYb382 TaxID=2745278 RepID=UPI0030AA3DC9
MKKVLLTMTVALLAVAGAQAQTSWGLKGGVNLGKYSNVDGASNNTSFHVTGFADLPLSEQFSIQPGVSLQGKGMKFESKLADIASSKTTRNVMSVEIPVNAVYYIPAGSGDFFIGAGPYIGFNVSGKDKYKNTVGSGSNETDKKLKFSGDNKDLNLIDAGANFLLGYKLENGLLINGGYNLGLTNLVPKAADKVSNRVWSFGIGFQF